MCLVFHGWCFIIAIVFALMMCECESVQVFALEDTHHTG